MGIYIIFTWRENDACMYYICVCIVSYLHIENDMYVYVHAVLLCVCVYTYGKLPQMKKDTSLQNEILTKYQAGRKNKTIYKKRRAIQNSAR